ncbi:4911_t:CDS:1, partial [Gigaspora rosea]
NNKKEDNTDEITHAINRLEKNDNILDIIKESPNLIRFYNQFTSLKKEITKKRHLEEDLSQKSNYRMSDFFLPLVIHDYLKYTIEFSSSNTD